MPTPKYPLTQLVEVEWTDSASRGRWDSLENYKEERPARCKTAGYLVVKDRTRVIVALSQGDTHALISTVLDAITIPRGCVTRIRRLK